MAAGIAERRKLYTRVRSEGLMFSSRGTSCPSSPQVKVACRMVVMGSTRTGKSSLLQRFLNDEFSDLYRPTIEEFYRKMYSIRGEGHYQLDILDTSGYDPFPAARRLSLLTGDLFLIVCSFDNKASFEEALRIHQQIVDVKSQKNDNEKKKLCIPMIIAGNKNDIPTAKKEFTVEEAVQRLYELDEYGCKFIECSALSSEGVDDIFSTLFSLKKLPKQMSPRAHRRLQAEGSLDGARSRPADQTNDNSRPEKVANWRKTSLHKLVTKKASSPQLVSYQEDHPRRPSLRTDLLVAKAKTNGFVSRHDRPFRKTNSAPLGAMDFDDKKCAVM